MRCYDPGDAPALKEAVDSSLDELRPWMPWALDEPQTVEQKVQLLRSFRSLFDRGENFVYGLFSRDESEVVGGSGLHGRVGEGAFEIGPELGAPDGMALDVAGCMWIAMWGAGAVLRFTPAGEVIARIAVPARQVSSCCFGGPDLRTLFITTSQENYTPRQSAQEPGSGRLFAAEVDVPGRPADLYLPGAAG